MSTASLLRRRDVLLLLLGQVSGQLGAQVSAVAIPLLAVLALQATPWEAGLLAASGTVAFALIGLPAGAWVDRLPRRPVLVAADLVRAATLLAIPIAAALDAVSMGLLLVVTFVVGLARVFFEVAYQAYLPAVVGSPDLLAGNAALETVRTTGQIAGPGLGGWLVGVAGAANVVLVQIAAFATSALTLLAIGAREPSRPRRPRARLRTEIAEGLRFVLRTPPLRGTLLASAVSNFAFAMASAVSFIFMARTLRLDPTAIGLLVGAGAVTAMVGAAFTPLLARRVGSARIIWLALAVTGPLAALGPLAQPGLLIGVFVLSLAAGELGQIVYAIAANTLRQQVCPNELLGRVGASMRVLVMGCFPAGALVGGLLGGTIGVRGTLWTVGGVMLLASLPPYVTLRHVRDVEELAGSAR